MGDYIKQLIEQGEHETLDFKFQITSAKKIAKTLSAFANTKGGRLLIGVKDNGAIAGIRSDEEYYMVDSAASMYTTPCIKMTSKQWMVDGKYVLEVVVHKGEEKPYKAQHEDGSWLAYMRIKDENFLVNKVILKFWGKRQASKGEFLTYGEKEKWLIHFLDNNDKIRMSQFVKKAKVGFFKAEKILIKLLCLEVLGFSIDSKGVFYFLKEKNKS